ncbi:MAG: carbonate dehydratase [Betaproteobacteria bacterium]|nr:carbonate dehydratase [Betaproteobacteria bacterium]MBK9605192.1 carbonate dehydratase [Betaproteobacteria bacterium]
MTSLSHLFDNNRAWSERIRRSDPEFFAKLSRQQKPRYLWIGCADSRVPANEIVGLLPGELFVHRNIANVVVHSDLNCLSVTQFAVDVLQVEHIIVCGHYGCSGVSAALQNRRVGLADNWLHHVQDVHAKHEEKVDALSGIPRRIDRLCELNVIEQVANVCRTTVVRDAWNRGQSLAVHGWVYGLTDGVVRDLGTTATNLEQVSAAYRAALAAL